MNTLHGSSDCREHYLGVLESSLCRLTNLSVLNLGTLCSNAILKAVSESCPGLVELRVCGPAPKVTDLGLRYIAGQVPPLDTEKGR